VQYNRTEGNFYDSNEHSRGGWSHLPTWSNAALQDLCIPQVTQITEIRVSKNKKMKMYRIVILLAVLYALETFSVKHRKQHRLRVCESKVLSKIFRSKRDEVTEELRRLDKEEFYDHIPQHILFC
jgi:hypothetical protein